MTLINFIRLLPRRLQTSLYHRAIKKVAPKFRRAFEQAALRLEPEVKMRLESSDSFHGEIAFLGIYEDELSCMVHEIAKESGGLLVDVGANYGYFSLLWCGADRRNTAYAVEASVRNCEALRDNIRVNGFQDRIHVYEWAAGDEEGHVMFNQASADETGWGGISFDSSPDTLSIPCHRLDRMLVGKKIQVLKIDCEGADAIVLRGASGLIDEAGIPHIFFEENVVRQAALHIETGAAGRLLTAAGYQLRELEGSSQVRNYYAWLPVAVD